MQLFKKPTLQQISCGILVSTMLASSVFFSKMIDASKAKLPQKDLATVSLTDSASIQSKELLVKDSLPKHSFSSSTLKKARLYLLSRGFQIAYIDSILSDKRLTKLSIFPKSKPQRKLTYEEYKKIFGVHLLANHGKRFYAQHRQLFDSLQQATNVPASLVLSILGIESNYGKHTGSHKIVNVFLTIIEEKPARAEFALEQLSAFLDLCLKFEADPYSVKGSHWGAFLTAQFIPTSVKKYLGVVNPTSFEELFSTENSIKLAFAYLADSGASVKSGFSVGSDNYKAALAYNPSSYYARLAVELAALIQNELRK
ncbi:MAG: lytic murein transglycosylase [Candidatus Micrarchaeota archaeon]|nr:lytic murein transglycosylase [Candidatus Micrarchaeota archaeon]